jgi:hypothetical protein
MASELEDREQGVTGLDEIAAESEGEDEGTNGNGDRAETELNGN